MKEKTERSRDGRAVCDEQTVEKDNHARDREKEREELRGVRDYRVDRGGQMQSQKTTEPVCLF